MSGLALCGQETVSHSSPVCALERTFSKRTVGDELHAAALSSLSAPRITTLSASCIHAGAVPTSIRAESGGDRFIKTGHLTVNSMIGL